MDSIKWLYQVLSAREITKVEVKYDVDYYSWKVILHSKHFNQPVREPYENGFWFNKVHGTKPIVFRSYEEANEYAKSVVEDVKNIQILHSIREDKYPDIEYEVKEA